MTLHFRITKSDKGFYHTEFANHKLTLKPQGFVNEDMEGLKKDILALVENYFKSGK